MKDVHGVTSFSTAAATTTATTTSYLFAAL
jgi:hypothetical protein